MPNLVVHSRARDDVMLIASRIAEDNLGAALNFYDAADRAFRFLSENPGAGPVFDPPIAGQPEMRFWPITPYRNYLVIYQRIEDGAEIARVVHGARDLRTALARP